MSRFLGLISLMILLSCGLTTAHAQVKEVKLQWEEIDDSTGYELEIIPESDGRKRLIKPKKSQWSGNIPYGVYSYRVRGVDRASRPGEWTEPVPLVVLPPAPKLLAPKDDGKIEITEKDQPKVFKWEKTPATQQYKIQVMRGDTPVLSRTVSGTEVDLRELQPGKYTWTVQAIIQSSGRGPASVQGRQWESPPGKAREIQVGFVKMIEPEAIFPVGHVMPTATGKLRFNWKKVPHAKLYEVTLEKDPEPGSPAPQPKTFKVASNALVTQVQEFGNYRWKVRALASATTLETATSESTAIFDLGPSDASGGKGYIGLSTLFAPYQYGIQTPAGRGSLDSQSLTLRLTGESWLSKSWGVGGGVQNTFVKISNSAFTWLDYEVYGKYHVRLKSWSGVLLVPKFGVENRQYLFVSQTLGAVAGAPGPMSLESRKVSTIGPSLGFDLRKQFDERWSAGLKLTYFKPVVLMGAPPGSTIAGGGALSNVSAGLQGFYWYSRTWGTGLGAFFDRRSFGFESSATGPTEVNLDAVHLFGSILFRL